MGVWGWVPGGVRVGGGHWWQAVMKVIILEINVASFFVPEVHVRLALILVLDFVL